MFKKKIINPSNYTSKGKVCFRGSDWHIGGGIRSRLGFREGGPADAILRFREGGPADAILSFRIVLRQKKKK